MASIQKPISRKIVDDTGQLDPEWDRQLGRALEAISGPLPLRSYTLATLPDAGKYTEHVIYVSDATGGPVPVYSNGTNWLRFSDDTTVS